MDTQGLTKKYLNTFPCTVILWLIVMCHGYLQICIDLWYTTVLSFNINGIVVIKVNYEYTTNSILFVGDWMSTDGTIRGICLAADWLVCYSLHLDGKLWLMKLAIAMSAVDKNYQVRKSLLFLVEITYSGVKNLRWGKFFAYIVWKRNLNRLLLENTNSLKFCLFRYKYKYLMRVFVNEFMKTFNKKIKKLWVT